MKKFVVVIATMLLSAACGGDARDAAPAPAPVPSAGAPVSQGKSAEDVATLRGYELTMEKLDRVFRAQLNLVSAIAALSPSERQAMEAASASSPEDGLDDVIARLDANTVAKKAVIDAGMTTRDYITASMALMQASMAWSVIQSRPGENQDSLSLMMDTNPGNVRFVRDNMAELTRRQEEMSAEMSRRGLTQ
jgi:hypothetical protein